MAKASKGKKVSYGKMGGSGKMNRHPQPSKMAAGKGRSRNC